MTLENEHASFPTVGQPKPEQYVAACLGRTLSFPFSLPFPFAFPFALFFCLVIVVWVWENDKKSGRRHMKLFPCGSRATQLTVRHTHPLLVNEAQALLPRRRKSSSRACAGLFSDRVTA